MQINLRDYQTDARKQVCAKCNEEKLLSDFYYRKDNNKYNTVCKQCTNKRTSEYAKNNSESIKQYKKKYYKDNIDKIKQYDNDNRDHRLKIKKAYREKNKKAIKEYMLIWRDKNKTHIKKYEQDNKESANKRKIKYRQKEEIKLKERIWRKNYYKAKRENDPEFRLKSNLRKQFATCLKNQLRKKYNSFYSYTDIALREYVNHFKQSPYWNNFENGNEVIHIDHIIPVRLYDFKNPEEIRKCWNPKNLRLIPASENMSKKGFLDIKLVRQHKIEHLLPEKILCNQK